MRGVETSHGPAPRPPLGAPSPCQSRFACELWKLVINPERAPDPTILFVKWDDGSSDEYFRLINPLFTLIRYSTAAGTVATAFFQARLVASGEATDNYPGSSGAGHEFVSINMTNDAGAIIYTFGGSFGVLCNDDRYLVLAQQNFEPALYDIVAGANWQFTGGSVARCVKF